MKTTKSKVARMVLLIGLAALLAASCGKKVTRVDTRSDIDLSGRWNDGDSRRVADAMIEDVLSFPWIEDFRAAHNNEKPIVIAYGVKNRTAEHINTQLFMNDLRRAFIRSGRVRVVADRDQRADIRDERAEQQTGLTEAPAAIGKELGANYVLTGVLNDTRDREGDEAVIFYQADMDLIDVETSEVIWTNTKKIKKFIERDSVTY